jgi:hypothetical protein
MVFKEALSADHFSNSPENAHKVIVYLSQAFLARQEEEEEAEETDDEDLTWEWDAAHAPESEDKAREHEEL